MKINEENRKEIEASRREKLRQEKPLVYDKIIQYDEKGKRGECTAIIDFCFDYMCNMNCSHCCNLSFAKKERVLTIETMRDIARQADELGLAQFNISGGEPTLFPNLEELVQAIDPTKFHLGISSNGLLINKEKAEFLKRIGIDKVRVSVDSLNSERYKDTRKQEGAYNKAVEALFHLKEAGIATAIGTVVSHQTCQTPETESIAKFANDNEFHLDVFTMKAIGALEGQEEVLITPDDAEHLMNLRNEYPVLHKDTYPTYGITRGCGTVRNTLHITRYGDVLPCVYIHISIGNIFDEPLKDIIERGLSIKWFNEFQPTCLSGEHTCFIQNYMSKFYGKPLPISYKDAFTEEDYIK